MRIFLSYLLAFAVISVLPVIWNQLTFREIGFPFTYLHHRTFVTDSGSTFILSFVRVNFFYDAALVAGGFWVFRCVRKRRKEIMEKGKI